MGPNDFTTEAFTLLGFGLAVISLRTYSRITTVGFRGLQADDYLMLLAAAVYTVETYLAYTVGEFWHGMANNGMTDKQRAALAPYSPEWWLRVNGSKTHVAGWTVYTFLLWIMKAAMCTFYLRLTDKMRHLKIRVHIGFVLIATTWIAVTLSILVGCPSFEKNWQIYPDPGNYCQPAVSRINIFVTVILNVLTDLYLLCIPIPMLWQASLPKQKKVGLIVLFGAGIFVTMAGILRCVLIVSDPVNGGRAAGPWGVRETFVAVLTSNIPMIYPLIRRILGSEIVSTIKSTLSTSKSGSGETKGSRPLSLGGVKLESQSSRRPSSLVQHHRYPSKGLDLPVNESQEYIYESFIGGRRVQHRHRLDRLESGAGKSDGGESSSSSTPTGAGLGPAVQPHTLINTSGGGVPAGCIKKEVTLQVTTEERPSGAALGTPMGLDDDTMAASDFGYHQVAFGGPQGTARRNAERAGGGAPVWRPTVEDENSSRDSFTFITHASISEAGNAARSGGRGARNIP